MQANLQKTGWKRCPLGWWSAASQRVGRQMIASIVQSLGPLIQPMERWWIILLALGGVEHRPVSVELRLSPAEHQQRYSPES